MKKVQIGKEGRGERTKWKMSSVRREVEKREDGR